MTKNLRDLSHLIDECIHCGFCLPTCPTFALWGEEMDSPRGRIHLMDQIVQGEPITAAVTKRFDNCLGCMSCLTACPSGVKYDQLLEATQLHLNSHRRRRLLDRMTRAALFAILPYRSRLNWARRILGVYRLTGLDFAVRASGFLKKLSPTLAMLESLAPRTTAKGTEARFTRGVAPRRATVAMLTGCVQGAFFSSVNAATVRVLAAEGCDVVSPEGQGCCGALSQHAGRTEQARALAKSTIATFSVAATHERVVVNSAGCGAAMKTYGNLLDDDAEWSGRAAEFSTKVRDISEFLVELGPRAERRSIQLDVAYHDACHLAHAQSIRSAPRQLLAAIPGLVVKEIEEAALCCGSAGTWNILNPVAATELGIRKAKHVADTQAQLLVAGNPGCLLQISNALGRGVSIPTCHTIELLDAAISGSPFPAPLERRPGNPIRRRLRKLRSSRGTPHMSRAKD